MSYDLHGSWEQVTGHHSGLYARTDESGSQTFLNTVSSFILFTMWRGFICKRGLGQWFYLRWFGHAGFNERKKKFCHGNWNLGTVSVSISVQPFSAKYTGYRTISDLLAIPHNENPIATTLRWNMTFLIQYEGLDDRTTSPWKLFVTTSWWNMTFVSFRVRVVNAGTTSPWRLSCYRLVIKQDFCFVQSEGCKRWDYLTMKTLLLPSRDKTGLLFRSEWGL